MKKYTVFGDRILVKLAQQTQNTEGGLLLPNEVKRPPRHGHILEVGDKVLYLKKSDKIYFNEYSGQALHLTDDLVEPDLIVMREDEVLAREEIDEIAPDCS